MGMQQIVVYNNIPPQWTAARDLLAARGISLELRMIDGELSAPDDQPPEAWKELRFGVPGGMVTVRRGDDRYVIVAWGNADAALRHAWNAVTWGFAAAGHGDVLTELGRMTLADFQARAELPPAMQSLF